jgi:hypothetical protein
MRKAINSYPRFWHVSPLFWPRFQAWVIAAIAWAGITTALAQNSTYSLGMSGLLVGPVAGADSVELAVQPPFGAWTAAANSPWLHLSVPNQSGIGSTNVVFNFDANSGATRTGTLTIAGQTVTITQAGSTYVAANALSSPLTSGGNSFAYGLAVDSAGNVYSADLTTCCRSGQWRTTP